MNLDLDYNSVFVLSIVGVAYQCYHGFLRAVQEGNIQWESRTYPYPGTPITQRFSHSKAKCSIKIINIELLQ